MIATDRIRGKNMFSDVDDQKDIDLMLDKIKIKLMGLTNEYARFVLVVYFFKPFIVILMAKIR